MRFDIYKQPFHLLLPDGKEDYRTCFGGIVSILTSLLLLSFAAYKLDLLMGRVEYKVQLRQELGYYEDTDRFGAKNDFAIAAAITGDYQPLMNIPEEIGSLKFYSKSWSNGNKNVWKDIELRYCNRDEF